jgi:hypothetical protein
VTDWAGEGTEGETLTLSKIGWRIIIFNCFYFLKKYRETKVVYIPIVPILLYLIILKIQKIYIKRYRRKNKTA